MTDRDRRGEPAAHAGRAAGRGSEERAAERLATLSAETEAGLNELRRLAARREELERQSADLRAQIAAVQSTHAWRGLDRLRRLAAIVHGNRRRPVPGKPRASRFVRTAPLGVNVAGYLDTESGMGEAARASIRSLEAVGIPFALNNVPSRLRQRERAYATLFGNDNPHPFNLVHLNADNMGWFAREKGRRYFSRRYTIGYWFWELASFPPEWIRFFKYVDEVWAASEFMRSAYAAYAPVPVTVMPPSMLLPERAAVGRAHFDLPSEACVFLYIFDVSSQMERKNPMAAIDSFRKARFGRGDAVLVLKFTNAEYDRAAVRRLFEAADGLDVRCVDHCMPRAELLALLDCVDCYFSPHRSEGFGLTMLEAMRLGTPVIATGYSGNLDFMTPENSFLIPFTTVTLSQSHGPYMPGAQWAEPDVEAAARLMRHVVEHRDDARRRGLRAQQEVSERYAPAASGARLRRRLEAIRLSADPAQDVM